MGTGVFVAPAASAASAASTTGAGSALLGAFGGPIGLAVTAGITGLTMLIGSIRKRGQQKLKATEVVNYVEPYMQENVREYLATENRTSQLRDEAINNFYDLWTIVLQNCGDPALGEAGDRCISERQEGANPSWGDNWFKRYLDPIRNDTNIVSTGLFSGSGATGTVQSVFPLLLGAGAIALAFGMGK